MDGNIQRALWLGVSVLIFLAVVMVGMAMFQSGKELVENGTDELNATAQTLSNAKFSQYDNKSVSGNDVINAINNYKMRSGEIQIIVTNAAGGTVAYVSGGTPSTGTLTTIALADIDASIQSSQNKSQTSAYINPYGKFYGTLIYDTNKEVRGIQFVQR